MPASKSETELLNKLHEEVNIARRHRRIYLTNWNYWEQCYDDNLWGLPSGRFESGKRRQKQNDQNFYPQVNQVAPIVESIIPKIHIYTPLFEVVSVYNDEASRFSALVWETLADVFYELFGLYDTIEEIIMDTLILGGGVHKTGYSYEMESPGYTLGDSTINELAVYNENVFSGYVSPKTVLWDYRVKRWQDKRWFAEEIDKPLEEVKNSTLYRNTSDLKGTVNPSEGIEGIRRNERRDHDNEMVKLIEYHDLAEGKIITIADGHNRILRNDEDYGYELYNQLMFNFTRPRRFWGMSLAQRVEEHAIAISKAYYYLLAHTKKSGITKLLIEAASMNPEATKKLKSELDFEVVPVDGVSQGNPVQELKLTGATQDWYNNFALIDSVIRHASGVTQQERGKHESGVRTAFEIARLQESSDARNQHRVKKLNVFISDVMSKMLRIASENMHPGKIAEFVGLPQEYAFMIKPFDRVKLQVKFGSTALEARNEKLNRVMNFVQLVSATGLQVNPQAFTELVSDALGLELQEKNMLMQAQQGGSNPRPPATNIAAANSMGGMTNAV